MKEKWMSLQKRQKIIVGVSVVALMAIVIVVAVALSKDNKKEYALSEDAKDGTYSMDELSEYTKKENFQLQINGHPIFENGTEKGTLMIRNPNDNDYKTQVIITLDEDGSQLYASEVLEPGHQVGYGALEKVLEKGDYAATAVFHILDKETGEEIGETQVGIKITVES